MAARTFRTDVINELGLESKEAESAALQVSLALPSRYFELRQRLLRSLLNDNVQRIYDTVWQALTEGRDINGNPILPMAGGGLERFRQRNAAGGFINNYQPRMAESEVNAIAMAISKGFKDLIENELVERVLPMRLYTLAMDKTAAGTRDRLASANPRV